MPKYAFSASVTVSAFTVVEADSEGEARVIANDRELAGLAHNALYPGDDEAWHIEIDGDPQAITCHGEVDED